jgi:S1-C subfamily serine protease
MSKFQPFRVYNERPGNYQNQSKRSACARNGKERYSQDRTDVNPKLVAYYDLPAEKGVVVTNVVPGSEADKSGIEAADILIRMDETEIKNVRDLIKVLNKHKVGDRVTMEFFRGHEKVKLKTVLENQ